MAQPQGCLQGQSHQTHPDQHPITSTLLLTQATRELKSLIIQNKTTINLRVWLSVLAENRKRHSESEINIIGFIVQQYGKGLLDPLDKVPSLEKTVFRISELLVKLYFHEETQNVSLALQRTWNEFYLTTLKDEEP